MSCGHRELAVEVTAAIEIDRSDPEGLFQTQPFEIVREEAFDTASLDKDSPAHFLYPSRLVPRLDAVADYARESFPEGRPILVPGTNPSEEGSSKVCPPSVLGLATIPRNGS